MSSDGRSSQQRTETPHGCASSPRTEPHTMPHNEGTHMPAKTTDATDITDDELEPVADETANSARRVVAAYATDADECRMLLSMLGIAPGENA
mgnify:FL=1